MDTFEITIVVTPISEEILKALPILFFATVLAPKKDALFTASMAVGIGFAVLENAFYPLNSDSFHMIVAILALIVSVISICIMVGYNKKKLLPWQLTTKKLKTKNNSLHIKGVREIAHPLLFMQIRKAIPHHSENGGGSLYSHSFGKRPLIA